MGQKEVKRKEADIQGASSSSVTTSSSDSVSSSSPIDIKKRRIVASAARLHKLIRDNISVIRDFRNVEYCEREKISAIKALERVAPVDEAGHVDIMVDEGITSLLIEQISETASPSGSNGATSDREILERCALSLLRDLVMVKPEVGRLMIEGGAVPRLFHLLRRQHKHADDELALRLQTLVFETLEKLSRDGADHLLTTLLAQGDYDNFVNILRGLMSPQWRIQVLACNILRALAESSQGQHHFVSDDCSTQLTVLLSSKVDQVRSVAAGTIMALCFSKQEMFEVTIETFLTNGVVQPIVHMLFDLNDECRLLATQLVTCFLRAKVYLTTTFTLAGAVRPLVQMLFRPRLLKDAVFALHHLSVTIQADAVGYQILLVGGIEALMSAFLLPNVQRDRELVPVLATLLFRLAAYRDGLIFFIKNGGIKLLKTTEMYDEMVREKASTFWHYMAYLMMSDADGYKAKNLVLAAREADAGDKIRWRCVHALAVLAFPGKYEAIFVYHNFLEIILDLYGRSSNEAQQQEAAEALFCIASRSRDFLERHALASNLDMEEIVGEAFIYQSDLKITNDSSCRLPTSNTDLDFDVTFLLDENTKEIRAHKSVLREASRVFVAILADDDQYFKNTGGIVHVTNIGYSAFKLVIDFIYTGRLRPGIKPYQYLDILVAANFYELFSLKRVCELCIARQQIVIEAVADIYDFAETYDAKFLMHTCILFTLEYHQQVRSLTCYATLVKKIIPEIRRWFPTIIPGPQYRFTQPLSGL